MRRFFHRTHEVVLVLLLLTCLFFLVACVPEKDVPQQRVIEGGAIALDDTLRGVTCYIRRNGARFGCASWSKP